MRAHDAIELIMRRVNNGLTHKSVGDFLVDEIKKSEKFLFDFGENFPVTDVSTMREMVSSLRLPFPLCFFTIPKAGAMLAYDDGSENIRFFVFLDDDGRCQKTMIEPSLLLAISKSRCCVVSMSADDDIAVLFRDIMADKVCAELVSAMPSFVIRGLNVLYCSNVTTVDNPPPEKLNKKRVKNGKVPIFSYKTLHIRPKERTTKSASIVALSRNSPRVHMRRGHIRRLEDGKTTWVQSCLVGDFLMGSVKKDYVIHG